MIQNTITIPIIVYDDELATDYKNYFSLHNDSTLIEVSGTNKHATNPCKVHVGTSDDEDCYLANAELGAANAVVKLGRTDFIGEQFPRITKDTVITVNILAAALVPLNDPVVILTFLEG